MSDVTVVCCHSLRRADHSSIGVLPCVVSECDRETSAIALWKQNYVLRKCIIQGAVPANLPTTTQSTLQGSRNAVFSITVL
jgi:hypothetical protein